MVLFFIVVTLKEGRKVKTFCPLQQGQSLRQVLRMSSADYTYPKMREHSIPNSHPHISELGYHSETVRVLRTIFGES